MSNGSPGRWSRANSSGKRELPHLEVDPDRAEVRPQYLAVAGAGREVAGVEDGAAPLVPGEPACGRQVWTAERIDRGVLEARQAGWDVLVGRPPALAEAGISRERASVHGEVDGLPQAHVREGLAKRVEEEVVDVRRGLGEDSLPAGPGGLATAARSGLRALSPSRRRHGWVAGRVELRVVGAAQPRRRPRRASAETPVRIPDLGQPAWPRPGVVRVPAEHEARDLARARRRSRARPPAGRPLPRLDRRVRRDRAEVRERRAARRCSGRVAAGVSVSVLPARADAGRRSWRARRRTTRSSDRAPARSRA